jgi:drug/metabolite transporter (DMT)-like permease
MVVFGSATPISRIVSQDLPPFLAAGVRVALGAGILLPFAWPRLAGARAMGPGDWLRTLAIAAAGMFGFTILMLLGMRRVSGVVGAVVMSTTPAITATGAVLFLGERATWRRVVAVLLAVAGVLVLQLGGTDGGRSSWTGIALVLGAVVCEAAYTLLGKRVSRDVDPLVVAFLAAAMAAPAFLPLALLEVPGLELARVSREAWLALAWYGAGTLALGSWLWYSGVARTAGSAAAGFMGLMPCSALGLSYLLLDEPFRAVHPLGFAIVLSGVGLISWEHARGGD